MVSKKKIHYLCEERFEKSLPCDHCRYSASLVKPAGDSWDGFFLSHPHTSYGILYNVMLSVIFLPDKHVEGHSSGEKVQAPDLPL